MEEEEDEGFIFRSGLPLLYFFSGTGDREGAWEEEEEENHLLFFLLFSSKVKIEPGPAIAKILIPLFSVFSQSFYSGNGQRRTRPWLE